jgi:integrase
MPLQSPPAVYWLLHQLHQSVNPLLGPLVQLMMLTGCRRGEALNAKKKEFDLERGSWLLPDPKGGKARHIPMNERAIDTVKAALLLAQSLNHNFDKTEYVFANPRTGLPFEQIYYSWNTARKKAGLDDLRMHDLRHIFASAMVNSGMTLYDVNEILGHANIKTTQRYAHLSHDTLLEAANTASNAVGAVMLGSHFSAGSVGLRPALPQVRDQTPQPDGL